MAASMREEDKKLEMGRITLAEYTAALQRMREAACRFSDFTEALLKATVTWDKNPEMAVRSAVGVLTKLQDPEFRKEVDAFLKLLLSWYPDDSAAATPAEQKQL